MDTAEIPESTHVGVGCTIETLATLLGKNLDAKFIHCDIVFGDESSGRVFYQNTQSQGVSFPHPYSAHDLAHELLTYGKNEARYPEQNGILPRKGWEISRFRSSDGSDAYIARATWV